MKAEMLVVFRNSLMFLCIILSALSGFSQAKLPMVKTIPYKIYPRVNEEKPDLPSPFIDRAGAEYVIAVNKEMKFAIIPVSSSNDKGICPQLIIDTEDFPELGKKGLHSEKELDQIETITDWSLDTITLLGRPNGLSQDGFMAQDEDILSVLKGDNHLVKKLGLTHPQLAKPLFHVLNMMDTDLEINRWNMSKHRWENILYFFYNKQKVFVDAGDTKGGQKSIFDDGIMGSFHIHLWREIKPGEMHYLKNHYNHLSDTEFTELKTLLGQIFTGEMEPQFIMRYGFYEGHTNWRTDPIAISFIFGLKSLEELDGIFKGKLYEMLTEHFRK
ncbi:MAG: hypothetical protein QNK30_16035 [Bacteroidales bacterium]|nr:hypothetical protein [Bacteroidales bacterium]